MGLRGALVQTPGCLYVALEAQGVRGLFPAQDCVRSVGPWRLGAVAYAYNSSTLGGRGGWITRSRDRDRPGQHGETPSLLKIQKLAGCGGAHL